MHLSLHGRLRWALQDVFGLRLRFALYIYPFFTDGSDRTERIKKIRDFIKVKLNNKLFSNRYISDINYFIMLLKASFGIRMHFILLENYIYCIRFDIKCVIICSLNTLETTNC